MGSRRLGAPLLTAALALAVATVGCSSGGSDAAESSTTVDFSDAPVASTATSAPAAPSTAAPDVPTTGLIGPDQAGNEQACRGFTSANATVAVWPDDAELQALPGAGGLLRICRFTWEAGEVAFTFGAPADLQPYLDSTIDGADASTPHAVTFGPPSTDPDAPGVVEGWGSGRSFAVKVTVTGLVDAAGVAAVLDAGLHLEPEDS